MADRREEKALQRAILNSATFSSIATDARGVIQIFNVGAERMLGYAAADVIDTITLAEISDPAETRARAEALTAELGTPILPGFESLVFKASRGIEDIYELTLIRRDGSRFPAMLSVTALRDDADGVIGYLLIGTDNTARKQAEEERGRLDQLVRDQQFYTRSLIESSVDALITTDPRGIITDVNAQTQALTGCTRDELIGAPFKQHFTDPIRAEVGIHRVLREGKVSNFELTAQARDGRKTVVSYNATTFHDRDRRLQGVFAAARDVTELKRYEHTLREKNAELEAASRMKSEFLANMSHELRTPLNAVIGFSEILRDGLTGALTGQQRSFVDKIFSGGQHLLALINDILDLAKVEAGKMELDLEPVQISALVRSSLSVINEKAQARRIQLATEIADDLGTVRVDPRKVKQIVYNLLSNAVKFTLEGGRVTLRARRVPRAEVGRPVGANAHRTFPLAPSTFAEFLEISVADSGIGVTAEGLGHLFKPFSQIDGSLARRFEGTGLGLAMVKLLAELHGGTAAVQSAVGEGSCFTIWLPLRPAEDTPRTASAEVRAVTAPLDASGHTALVVEDDPRSAELIRLQLEAMGFVVVHAATGHAALALATAAPPTVVTLDINLPDMDGWELLERFKALPALARVPVVIVSIVAERNKGFALGAAAVLQKPLPREELTAALHALGLLPRSATEALRVLVVDDQPEAVELISAHLVAAGATVLSASGGREGIETARRELPDLIVLDLMMPDVNGFDVVAALSGRDDTAKIPILVLTAMDLGPEERATLNGFVRVIMEKDAFDAGRFAAEFRRALSGRIG